MTPVLKIEVDMFSGRPNPGLELRGSRALRLRQLLEQKRLPLNDVEAVDQLGFRGFIIKPESAGRKAYRVKGEVVQIGGRAFLDPNKDTQNYILSILPQGLKAMLRPLLDVDRGSRQGDTPDNGS
jgi:hypothetical protein